MAESIQMILSSEDEQTCDNFTVQYLSPAHEGSSSQYLDDGISKKIIELWKDGDTKQLLDSYYQYLNDIGPLKKFKNKKVMWLKIAEEIGGKTGKQCEQRFKTVMRRKKLAVDNNKTSGHKRKLIEYEEELRKIASIDDSVEPDIQIISTHSVRKVLTEQVGKENKIKQTPNYKKQKTVQETLLEIFEKKEQAKEKRHKERMAMAERMEKLLLQVLEQNKSENPIYATQYVWKSRYLK